MACSGVLLLTFALLTLQATRVSATALRRASTQGHGVAIEVFDKLAQFKLLPKNYFYESKQLRPAYEDDDYDEEEEEDEETEEELNQALNEEAAGTGNEAAEELGADGNGEDDDEYEGDEGEDEDGDDEEERHLENMQSFQRFMQGLLPNFH